MLEFFVIILVLIGLFVLGSMFSAYSRRRQMLAALAARLRMRFFPRDSLQLLEKFSRLYLTQPGHSPRISNIIQGRRKNHQFFFFDYKFETGAAGDRAVRSRCVLVCCQSLDLPGAVALRDDTFEPIASFHNFVPVSIGTDFDSHLQLYSDFPGQIRKILTPPLRRILMGCDDCDWEFQKNYLVFHSETVLSPLRIARLIRAAGQCCRALAEGKKSAPDRSKIFSQKNS